MTRDEIEREAPAVTVTAETYGDHDEGPDVIVVRIRGEEVGAYCIGDDPEAERRTMRRMVDALLAQGRAEMRAWLRNKADRTEQHGRTGFADLAAMVLRAAADDLDADTSEESER